MLHIKDKTILVVEDNPNFQYVLKGFLQKIGFTKIEIAANYEMAHHLFTETNPDIALIDIDLGEKKTGIDVANMFNSFRKIPFIFITSNYFEESYNEAKQTGPTAFISKEITKLDLKQAIELGFRQSSISQNTSFSLQEKNLTLPQTEIFVKIGNTLKKIALEDVEWFGIDERFAYIRKGKRQFPLSVYLKELEEIVSKEQFIRIHQSYLINIKKIDSINTMNNTVTIADEELPVGRSYRKNFFKRIKFF